MQIVGRTSAGAVPARGMGFPAPPGCGTLSGRERLLSGGGRSGTMLVWPRTCLLEERERGGGGKAIRPRDRHRRRSRHSLVGAPPAARIVRRGRHLPVAGGSA